MTSYTPLDRAFADQSRLRGAISLLFQNQKLEPVLAETAAQEWIQYRNAGEYWLDAATRLLITDKINPLAISYITEGECKLTGRLVRQRRLIDDKIRSEVERTLQSREARLVEQYPVNCNVCTESEGESTTHATLLSFTEYNHAGFLDVMDKFYAADLAIHDAMGRYLYVQDQMPAQKAQLEIMAELGAKRQIAKSELRNTVMQSSASVLWTTARVKGTSRLAEKVKRLIAELQIEKKSSIEELESVNDLYGTRIITKTREDAVREMYTMRDFIHERHPYITIFPTKMPHNGDPEIACLDKPGKHYSMRMTMQLGVAPARIPWNVQAVALDDWFMDFDDHPDYEKKQRSYIKRALQENPALQNVFAAVDKLFYHDAEGGKSSPGAFGTSS
jgi:hypothetical protein